MYSRPSLFSLPSLPPFPFRPRPLADKDKQQGLSSVPNRDLQVKLGLAGTDESFWSRAYELSLAWSTYNASRSAAGGESRDRAGLGPGASSAPLLSASKKGGGFHVTVSHYAGRVTYDTRGFVEKNTDKVLEDQRAALLSSNSDQLRALFTTAPAADGGARANATIASRFSRQLVALMRKLDSSRPQFVRCIKPNNHRAAGDFDARLCQSQLACSGVFEATAIKRGGFPFRASHQGFVSRYRCCADEPPPRVRDPQTADWPSEAAKLLAALPYGLGDGTRIKLGRTMVLWKVGLHDHPLLWLTLSPSATSPSRLLPPRPSTFSPS